MAVKAVLPPLPPIPLLTSMHTFCSCVESFASMAELNVCLMSVFQVIPLDITLELQKQIMSELEILYKVQIFVLIGIALAYHCPTENVTGFFLPFFFQCDSSYIIGFYGAFFVENRISLCTEFMDGELFCWFFLNILSVLLIAKHVKMKTHVKIDVLSQYGARCSVLTLKYQVKYWELCR